MARYDASLTLREARGAHFARSGIPADGGYSGRWIKLTKNRLPLYILNTAPRRRAVPYHDLHHVLTGYDTSYTGEAEIGAWEVAAGTRPHWMALLLDLAGMAIGLAIAPRATFAAFVRGRRSQTLYAEPMTESLLSARVGEVRARLGLDRPVAPTTLADRFAFLGYAGFAVLVLISFVVFAPVLILIGLFMQ